MSRLSTFWFATVLGACAVQPTDEPPTFDVATRIAAQMATRHDELGLSANDQLAPISHTPALDGIEHVRYQQTYRGVPLVHGFVTAMVFGDSIAHLEDRTIKGLDLDVVPRVTQSDAEARALADFGRSAPARAVLAIDTELERRIVRTRPATTRLNADEVTRVPVRHTLVWQVLVGDDAGSMAYSIDAGTGTILSRVDPSSSQSNSTARANTEYHGLQTINVVKNDPDTCGTFATIDWARGHSTFQVDGGSIFTSSTASFGDGAPPTQDYSNGPECDVRLGSGNAQTAGVDAELGLSVVWDMYKNVFNFPGWGGNNDTAVVYVHWQADNSQYVTSPFGDHMLFGDGDFAHGGTPHTTVDVIGHEFTHGIDHHVGTIGILSGENVMSEGIADIGGVFAQLYSRDGGFQNGASSITDTGDIEDFTLFHGIRHTGGAEHLRFLDRPSQDFHSSPDAYFDGIDNLDGHQSSGPLRRAFFYLAKGASGHVDWRHNRLFHSNSLLLPWGMKGIGVNQASKVWFETMFGCMADADFNEARGCASNVAQIFFGDDAAVAARNAFAGVNIGNLDPSYPAAPNTFLEQEPNDSTPQTGLHWSSPPVGFEQIFKMSVIGFMTDANDVDKYEFTAKCARQIGVRLMLPPDLKPAANGLQIHLFEQVPTNGGNWLELDLSQSTDRDPTVSSGTAFSCLNGPEQTYRVRVESNGASSFLPYLLFFDAQ